MNPEFLVQSEISRRNWAKIVEASGPATFIPFALQELLSARAPEEVDRAYWKLENHVVVQGQLFEAAIYVVPVLLAALTSPDRPRFVRIGILELLFQIVNGGTHREESDRGMSDIDVRCRAAARDGLWLLYREVATGEVESALEIIELIEDDKARLSSIKQAIG